MDGSGRITFDDFSSSFYTFNLLSYGWEGETGEINYFFRSLFVLHSFVSGRGRITAEKAI